MKIIQLKLVFKIYMLLILIACYPQEKEITETKKSIVISSNQLEEKYLQAKKQSNDSLLSNSLLNLVKFTYKKKQWRKFHKYRLEHIKSQISNKYIKTNSKILDYSGAYFRYHNRQDSAYYYYHKAYKVYDRIKDSLSAGKMLLNIAIIQKNTRDYMGSEATSFKALPYFKAVNSKRRISSIYNNLGIIYKHIEDFENALIYHSKAYELRKDFKKRKILEIHSLNNIGNVYKEKENYSEAIDYYNKALLKDSILNKNLKIKAMVFDNFAHAQFLNGQLRNLPVLFYNALKIRDSLNDRSGKIMSYIHLGEYYKDRNKPIEAKNYFERAKNLSKAIQYISDEIKTMEFLVSIYSPKKAIETSKRIIFLKDSLYKADRKVREQFSRIRNETLEKEKIILKREQELQKSELENNKKTIIILICLLTILAFSIIFILLRFKKYKQKQKFEAGFNTYLQEKYSLTPRNLEFWGSLMNGLSEKELADMLSLSINGIKSRRKALFSKIKNTTEINGQLDKSKAILIYKNELETYKNFVKN